MCKITNENKKDSQHPSTSASSTTNSNGSANATTTTKVDTTTEIVSGIPPWHSVTFLVAVVAMYVSCLPTLESLDKHATIEMFTDRVFNEYMSVKQLALIRAAIALSIWITNYIMITDPKGWTQITSYKNWSKLRTVPIKLQGWRTLFPFTSWAWTLLGLSFTINATIPLLVEYDRNVSPWLLRLGLILWEVSAPVAYLVSGVVKYAIWPAVLAKNKGKDYDHGLDTPRNFMQHNMNSIFALFETTMLGGLPIRIQHFALCPLLGITYVLFAWLSRHIHCPNEKDAGPQFLYWFFDTTLGAFTSYALGALLLALTFGFGIFVMISNLESLVGDSFILRSISLVALSSIVYRDRA